MSGDNFDNYGPAAKIYDAAAILNPETGLANLLANFTDATAEGHDTVDGHDTVRVTGKVSADAVNKIAPQLGATEPTPATVWIQPDGEHQLVQATLEQSAQNTIEM